MVGVNRWYSEYKRAAVLAAARGLVSALGKSAP